MIVRRGFAVTATTAVLVAALTAGCTTETVAGRGSSAAGNSAAATPSSTSRASSTPSSAPSGAAAANFRDCSADLDLDRLGFPAGRRSQLSFDCATVAVPLDYTRPTGRRISVAILRVHSDEGGRDKRSLLMNPGGPGGSGIDLAVSLSAAMSDTVLDSFDLIGFDPRGVGRSTPVRCLTDAQKDVLNAASPNVLTAAGRASAKASAKTFADACSTRYGTVLPQINTINTARDMDRVRQAVGDSSMNFLGFSYGTELGAQYARLFPRTVRTLVLDGAVNPLTDDITSFADQLQGFEDSFDQFAAYCRRTSPCNQLGDSRRVVYRIAAQATRSPIPSTTPGETRRATSALVYLGVLQALYSQSLWPVLANALQRGLAGDSSGLLALADQYNDRVDGKYSNISDANTTINCNDSEPGPTDTTVLATARSWAKRFPMFGLWSAPSLYSCQSWQPVRTPPPLPKAATAETVLVVGNINDPATPYRGAVDLTRTMGNAELLTWDGQGHTSYLQGSSCIDGHVDAYLVNGTLPPTNTKC